MVASLLRHLFCVPTESDRAAFAICRMSDGKLKERGTGVDLLVTPEVRNQSRLGLGG